MRYDVGRFRRPMRRSTEGQLMSLISLGDGSTLTLDFTTGVLDPRLTFTRASGGTYVANDGYIYGMDFATSSSLAIGTGSKSVTLTATAGVDRRYLVGQTVYISNGANNMSGPVTAYNASTQVLTINATATSGSGSFTSWSVGNASPRFDYDPTTLAPLGLLIEGTATTLVTYSPCSTTGWAGLNATGTNNSDTSPENTTAATLWTGGSGGVNRAYSAGFSVTSGSTYTISAYVKKPSSNAARYAKIDVKSAVEALIGWPTNGVLDLDTGIASGTGYTVTPMQNGWYRIVSTGTVNSTTTARMFLRITDAAGAEITSTNALLWWGAQAEAGSGASSLIPTGASTVQRLADECGMTGTNFSSWFNATEGTFLAHARRIRTTDLGRIASANDNTTTESIDLGADTTGEFIVTDGGSALATISPGTVTANTAFKIAGAYKLNDVQAALGGTLGTADTSVTLPTVDRLMVGRQAGGSPVYLNGTVAVLKYWPTRLTNAQLQSFTT